MRISGMATGMDIEQMVGDLMRAERMPLERMHQDHQELVLKMDDYREVNRGFMNFRSNTFDGILRQSNMGAKLVTSTNESLVSGTATSSAGDASYTISNVESLASAANNASVASINVGEEEFDPNAPLEDQAHLLSGSEHWAGDAIEFTIQTYDENGEREPVNFEFEADATLNDVLDGINRSSAGVQAFYDPFSERVSISRTETGVFNEDGNEMVLGFAGNDFLTDTLQLDGAEETGAQNARFTMNGLSEMERHSNTFTIDGLTIQLHNEFDESVQVSVENDTDTIFETVMGFVDDYNEMLEYTNGKINEEYYRDYRPLTDEQRRDMSESEIELWEERSQSGLLRHDSMLSGAMNELRTKLYNHVETGDPNQTFSHLTEIGLDTSSDYQERGRLVVDEAELRAAIEEDAEGVYQLFAAEGDDDSEQGLAHRVRDSLNHTIEMVGQRAGRAEMSSNQQFAIGREINQVTDRISNFERRMEQVEERYWAQFTRMEQAVSEANAQMQSLMQAMGGEGQMPM
ncbi:flagellar hook-associated protein 2 [Salipaludibacillus agaradhaerens]|uniref:flagellar hook-associated protein 2 n=1 Tax=Salipaludibacillus agaradhaerens TaxID=76935 RepID=UPI0009974BC9|nr:flagellar hook-associated protein 2 [Salipaludibacillus agaradhaerens]